MNTILNSLNVKVKLDERSKAYEIVGASKTLERWYLRKSEAITETTVKEI